jgi:alkylhydroperoxidase/carboxymuconolactone decarboxylase family protein YurZ
MSENMKKIIKVALLASSIFSACNVNAQKITESNDRHASSSFVKRQVAQNMSIGRAVKSIVSNYPQETSSVVSTALDMYPDKYQEIIHAAISAQPMFTEDIVRIALDKDIASCAAIVKTAINAEPSYVDFVVTAAANSTPEELNEIVRVAVITEPDSADFIVQSLAQQNPSKIVDILSSAIGAVPLVGEYVVEALLAVFPNDAESVVSTAVRESGAQRENVKRIIETAQNFGLDEDSIYKYAKEGGATDEEITAALTELTDQ